MSNFSKSKHIVIITGEASGDQHAAALVRSIRKDYPEQPFEFSGIGGPLLQKEGVKLIGQLAAVTGVSEVLQHLVSLYRSYKQVQTYLREQRPDLLILVDYPGFNLRLAKFAKKKLGLRILYYISPQIWAWKASRIHTIRESVDHMAVIFPFEKTLYDDAKVPCSFVGHPILEPISQVPDQVYCRKRLGLPLNQRIIALLPGSRKNEIKQHLPILSETVATLLNTFPDLRFIMPIASGLSSSDLTPYFDASLPIQLFQENALEVMSASDVVVVASGTASLECALLEKPMCIIYKATCLTYVAATQLMKVQYLGLCNLIAKRMIVPELMQYECRASTIAETVKTLLTDEAQRAIMIRNLRTLKHTLGNHPETCALSQLVYTQVTSN